ncbi:restriction endonuclease subunit S [Eggerthellaceae bacterium zg-1084]|uniref:restriction endonuclease subunit S n=1 Tax=Berryella wangjianweii TaxID=2734634 RepID=UPI001557F562|nr:restriction endonuclease subunit S [Berryella wangjianweii]NPD30994.1 restriction endonuclease subunit S [Berryella wangjianweii]
MVKQVSLADACILIMGQSPSSDSYNKEHKGLPFFQGNADFGKVSPIAKTWCTNPKKVAEKGDILLSVRAPIGAVNLASEQCCIGRGLAAVRPKSDGIRRNYLKHLLLACRPKLEHLGTGSTFKAIGKKSLSEFSVPLYRIEEQKQIEQRFELIFECVSIQNEVLVRFDELVKSRFIGMFGDPVGNTRGLPVYSVEELAASEKNAMKAGPFGSALKKSFYVESGYKIYGQEQVISGDQSYGDYYISEEKYEQLKSCRVKPRDVLISLVGTVGKVLILKEGCKPGIINPRLVKITFDESKILPEYFAAAFALESIRSMLLDGAHGQTMDVLNLGMIKKLSLPIPPIEQQMEYLAFVQQIDKLEFAYQWDAIHSKKWIRISPSNRTGAHNPER